MSEEEDEGRRKTRLTRNLSLQMDKQYPRDLLQTFMLSEAGGSSEYTTPNEQTEELELNLGLSLGGRFGVDRSPKKLIRSSSVATYIPLARQDDLTSPSPMTYPSSLMRASSLPTETEEEWRKRKELQMLRRMEAKRRRSEKQRISNSVPKVEDDARRDAEAQTPPTVSSLMTTTPAAVVDWAQAVLCGGKGKGGFLTGAGSGILCNERQSSLGSVESQGGGSSSGTSEWEPKQETHNRVVVGFTSGSSSCGGSRSPVSGHPPQDRVPQDPTLPQTKQSNNVAEKNRAKEIGTTAMEDMPCVFTKGDGPDGRRVEGILYKYGKGEEVRIMCVCHGSFLSPAEFVKHAGGGNVAHPLRHIVINPNPSFSR